MKLQPYTGAIAEQFLEGLSSSYDFPLDGDTRAAMLTLIGPPVPYFLLEYEFDIAFDQDQRRYRFACKLLRDWWLRHYSL